MGDNTSNTLSPCILGGIIHAFCQSRFTLSYPILIVFLSPATIFHPSTATLPPVYCGATRGHSHKYYSCAYTYAHTDARLDGYRIVPLLFDVHSPHIISFYFPSIFLTPIQPIHPFLLSLFFPLNRSHISFFSDY